MIKNTENNRIALAELAVERMSLEGLMCIVRDALIESYEESDEYFQLDVDSYVDLDNADDTELFEE